MLETVVCPIHEGHQRAGKRLTELSVRLPKEAAHDEFVWTWSSECLLQDHVVELFRANGLTGFEVKPVSVRLKNDDGEVRPKLWELVVVGWAGLTPAQSGIKIVSHCDACGHTVYSSFTTPEKLIDESKWDGSDLFIIWPLPRYIFVTERVVRLAREKNMAGVVVRPVRELPYRGADTLTPGRLSYVMPEDYARRFGEPLGIY
jgi:hypothetical protein